MIELLLCSSLERLYLYYINIPQTAEMVLKQRMKEVEDKELRLQAQWDELAR